MEKHAPRRCFFNAPNSATFCQGVSWAWRRTETNDDAFCWLFKRTSCQLCEAVWEGLAWHWHDWNGLASSTEDFMIIRYRRFVHRYGICTLVSTCVVQPHPAWSSLHLGFFKPSRNRARFGVFIAYWFSYLDSYSSEPPRWRDTQGLSTNQSSPVRASSQCYRAGGVQKAGARKRLHNHVRVLRKLTTRHDLFINATTSKFSTTHQSSSMLSIMRSWSWWRHRLLVAGKMLFCKFHASMLINASPTTHSLTPLTDITYPTLYIRFNLPSPNKELSMCLRVFLAISGKD